MKKVKDFVWKHLYFLIGCWFLFVVIPFVGYDIVRQNRLPLCERGWHRHDVRCVRYWMNQPIPQ